MSSDSALFNYSLRLADNANVLGHRLCEWCGKAPMLEEDMALSNLGLDLIGQARSLYTYAGEVEGAGRSEDDLAYLRDANKFGNVLLVEMPNIDFGATMLRHLFFSAYYYPFFVALCDSKDETLAAVAAKSEREMAYHLRHSAEWVIRLGDGTEESARRMRDALAQLWPYTGELFEKDAVDEELIASGVAVDPESLRETWQQTIAEVFERAKLELPEDGAWMQSGGRTGVHSEHLGYILADMQFLQRSYPGAQW